VAGWYIANNSKILEKLVKFSPTQNTKVSQVFFFGEKRDKFLLKK
jgi:hypothetical protein